MTVEQKTQESRSLTLQRLYEAARRLAKLRRYKRMLGIPCRDSANASTDRSESAAHIEPERQQTATPEGPRS